MVNAARGLVAALVLLPGIVLADPPPCPRVPATVSVFVENLSADAQVIVHLTGDLLDPAATCAGSGLTHYPPPNQPGTFTCARNGVVPCGEIPGLQPGTWVNRITTSVSGSDPQVQARRDVFIARDSSNFLVWTVYPRTFVVGDTTAATLRKTLKDAADYAPGPALVTFAASGFLDATSPRTFDLDSCPPQGAAAVCFTGSRVVVDALDDHGAPGAVVWSVGTRAISVLRLYGSENVFRGLVFAGSSGAPTAQVDTIAILGPTAARNHIERSVVKGPKMGDALSVNDGAGQDSPDAANVVDDCEITDAADKGVKATARGRVIVRQTCVHDNRNGGIQSTLGGDVIAVENVVQHNVPGPAQNGIFVRGTDARRSTLATQGNIVRFSGVRGLSVTGNAEATFRDDYAADNQFKGSMVETTVKTCCAEPDQDVHEDCVAMSQCPVGSVPRDVELVPAADFRGVGLVCNHLANLTRTCRLPSGDTEMFCTTVDDCCALPDGTLDQNCLATSQCAASFPTGAGAVTASPVGHTAPDVSYGDALEPGHNAFTANKNALKKGANFQMMNIQTTVPAEGNQWEHCPFGEPCGVMEDIAPPDAPVDIGMIPDPRAPDDFGLTRVSPPRPRAGDVVRVYGSGFNAIDGNPAPNDCVSLPACIADGTCPCSIENAAVEKQNRQMNATRLRIFAAHTPPTTLFPYAVTPTMIAFVMPFDCFAPLTLEVAKRIPDTTRIAATIPLCDPAGCAGAPAGLSCNDGSLCTRDDHCTGGPDGVCTGDAVVCVGQCLTGACDPAVGCVAKPAAAGCDDGNACTVGDHCGGGACVPGTPADCTARCLTGVCDPNFGCTRRPAGEVCRSAAGVCDVAETCDGVGPGCPRDALASASVICRPAAGECDVQETCDGVAPGCPPDAFANTSVVCRQAAGPCDAEERCNSLTPSCPPDVKRTDVCRSATSRCDFPEHCDGVHDDCPPDRQASDGSPCDDGDPCTADVCAGGSCLSIPLPPYAAAICALDGLLSPSLCGTDPVDDALRRALERRVARGERLLRAASEAGAGRRANRLLGRIDRTLGGLQRLAHVLVHARKITAGCGVAIDQAVAARRARVGGLRT